MVRPGRCGIVTTAAEPPGAGRRHNGMLNTLSLYRRSARTGRTRFGAAAGLAIGGAMLAGGMLLAGCSGSSAGSAAVVGVRRGRAVGRRAGGRSAGGRVGGSESAGGQPANTGTTARLAPASDIIYTAQLTVRAQNVGSAAAKAAQIAEASAATSQTRPPRPTRITRRRPPPPCS